MIRLIGTTLAVFLATASQADGLASAQSQAIQQALEQGTAKIVGLTKRIGPPPVEDKTLAAACRNWTLTGSDVLYFFTHATAVAPEELHSSYDVLPCQYSGSLAIGSKLYAFSINVGYFGVIHVTAAEGTALYGCKQLCKRLFPLDLYGDE